MRKDIGMAESCVCTDGCLLGDGALLRRMMETMLVVRKFEETVCDLFQEGKIHGTTHLCIGEEAANVGTGLALEEDDYVLGTHRGHGQALGKGADIRGMMAEMLGRETGLCRGRGGSMHMCDTGRGVLCTNGIVGANAPLACGAALSSKMKGLKRVTLTFLGDGSSNEGAVHESMNLAAAWGLPVIFCLIHNGYGMSTPLEHASLETNLLKRADGYGIKAVECDGNDVLQVFETVKKARAYAVENGPILVVEHSYRTSGHSKSDNGSYRAEEEIRQWESHNPLYRFSSFLVEQGLFTGEQILEMEQKADALVADAVAYGMESPEPLAGGVTGGVYA